MVGRAAQKMELVRNTQLLTAVRSRLFASRATASLASLREALDRFASERGYIHWAGQEVMLEMFGGPAVAQARVQPTSRLPLARAARG